MDFMENLLPEVPDENLTKAERLKLIAQNIMNQLPLPAKMMCTSMMPLDNLCNLDDEHINKFLLGCYEILDYINGE